MPRKPKVETAPGVYEKVKGSGIYWIRYTDAEGRRRKESVGRFQDAKERYQTRKLELKMGTVIVPKPESKGVKLGTLIDDALAFSKAHHTDQRNFKQRVEVWREAFGDRSATLVKPKDLSDWLQGMVEEWEWSAATYNRYKAAISKVFKLALQNSLVTANPASLVPQRKESPGRLRFLLEDEEKRLRVAILKKRPHCIHQLDIALHTGMRKGEQFSVTWDQVDFKHRYIYLEKTKNGSDRYVHLNDFAVESLQALKALRKELKIDFPTLFFDRARTPIKDPREWFSAACEEAKIKGVTWHILRHTFASRLVMEGVDLKTAQELMGHKTIAMTARYAHLSPSHLQNALSKLADRAHREG